MKRPRSGMHLQSHEGGQALECGVQVLAGDQVGVGGQERHVP